MEKDNKNGDGATTRLDTGARAEPDRWRLLRLALATVLAVFALFCFWQAWLIHGERDDRAAVTRARSAALQGVTGALQAWHADATKLLTDAEIRADLEQDTAAGREAAAERARVLLPQALEVVFYEPTMDTVVHADYRRFGYARASQLMRMLDDDNAPQFGVVANAQGHSLGLVQRMRGQNGQLLAYVWLDWSLQPLEQILKQTDPGAGRVALRAGTAGDGLVLFTHGGDTAFTTLDDEVSGQTVPGSALSITGATPLRPIVPFSRGLPAWLWGILALIAVVALLWPRLRRQSFLSDEEPVLSETTPTPAAAAKPAPSEKPAVAAASAPAASPAAATTTASRAAKDVDPVIFRAYDIRGVVGTQLTAEVAHALGRAIGDSMREQDLSQIVVGRDGRVSGPELCAALAEGLRAAGIDVIDVGAVPTPLVYYAAYAFNAGSCVAVTGSHNPPDYNGFKIVVGGETLSEDAIMDLHRRIVAGPVADGAGSYRETDVIEEYIERISSDVQAERPLKVVADAGNGIAGKIAPRLLEAIGCEVIPLFCEVDGQFPNHHPDPSDPQNMQDLIQAVEAMDADLGVAFDGDGDRLGVVTREGEIVFPDRLLVLFARDVLSRVPGATIIYDVKCTGHLGPEILQAGGSPLMWRTGHSLIKAKMRETEAQLAGEMSGHFFFRERWYGFDDGLYSAARLLEILAGDLEGRTADELFATLPKGVSTPELKIAMEEGRNHPFIARFQHQARFEGARLTTIDGVRADWPDGWGLVRASNTTPVLVLRFDAEDEAALERIKQQFREQLLALDPELTLPF